MRRLRILLVDDDADLLAAAANALHRRVDLVIAETAEEAVAHARTQRFDVVVVDFQLGATDGLRVQGALARHQPDAVRVLMSGWVGPDLARSAATYGIAVVEKPVDWSWLIEQAA